MIMLNFIIGKEAVSLSDDNLMVPGIGMTISLDASCFEKNGGALAGNYRVKGFGPVAFSRVTRLQGRNLPVPQRMTVSEITFILERIKDNGE